MDEPIVDEPGEAFEVDMDRFKESLPEELRNSEMIKNAKDMGSIAQMAVDNKALVGKKEEDFINSIPKNGDDPTALDIAYQKLGWPGVDGKYEVTRPEAVDGIDYNEAQEATFLEVAKELKLNGSQVNTLIAMQNEMQKGMLAENLKQATEANEALKAEWGDKYDANKAEVKAILEKHGDDSLVKLFNETELGSHVGFTKLLHDLGKGTIETSALGKGDAPVNTAIAKDEAQKEISRMYMDPEISKALEDTTHVDHNKLNEKMLTLHETIHGKELVA
jgi:hypothetical protein